MRVPTLFSVKDGEPVELRRRRIYRLDRLRLAWGVFTGRYDALGWRE